jgi:hypothetical protein
MKLPWRKRGSAQPFTPAVAEEQAYVAARLAERDAEGAAGTLKIGIFFNLCVMCVAPFIARPEYLWIVEVAAGINFTLDLLWTYVPRARFLKAIDQLFIFNHSIAGAFAIGLGIGMRTENPARLMANSGAVMALTAVLLIEAPFTKWRTPLMGLGFWLIAMFSVPWSENGLRWLVIYTVMVVFGVMVRQKAVAGMAREIRAEHQALLAERRVATAKVERDLELAREIQDSMAPSPDYQTDSGLHVQCVSCKFEAVGGDWLTARQWRDGTFVMVVADATGKGMQAALVVHAVQSLWATALDDHSFDAEPWLQQVNRALYRLGERQPHTATLGLATLKDKRLTYWGAGHLPLFLLLGADANRTQKILPSRGGVLGLSAQVAFPQQHIDLLPTYPTRIMLCSDGVLPRGSLTKPGEVEELYDGIVAGGSSYLATLPTADDRSIILVERGLARRQALPGPGGRQAM